MPVLGIIGIILVLWAAYKLLGVVFRLIQGLLILGIGIYLLQSAGIIQKGSLSHSLFLSPEHLISWLWYYARQIWVFFEMVSRQVIR